MATAPELLTTPEVVIRTMVETDVRFGRRHRARGLPVSLERRHLPGLPARRLRVPRGLRRDNEVIGYGVMSVGAGEAHILNLCINAHFRLSRCRPPHARISRGSRPRRRHERSVPGSAPPRIRRRFACISPWGSSRWAFVAGTIRRSAAGKMRPSSKLVLTGTSFAFRLKPRTNNNNVDSRRRCARLRACSPLRPDAVARLSCRSSPHRARYRRRPRTAATTRPRATAPRDPPPRSRPI